MRLIWGDDNDYKQWKSVIRDNLDLKDEIENLNNCLRIQTFSDAYKDDLIRTLKTVVAYDEKVIGDLQEEISRMRNNI